MSICLKNQKIIGDLKWRCKKISDGNFEKRREIFVKNNNVGKCYFFVEEIIPPFASDDFQKSFLFFF